MFEPQPKSRAGLFTVLALLLAGLFSNTCSEDPASPGSALLSGTWELTSLAQTFIYTVTRDYPDFGLFVGDTLRINGEARTHIGWNTLRELGVEGTMGFGTDGKYTLSGILPVPSDTIGNLPSPQPIADSGTWEVAESLDQVTLQGTYFPIEGDLSLNSETDPTKLTITYTRLTEGRRIYVPAGDQSYDVFEVNEISISSMIWNRQ